MNKFARQLLPFGTLTLLIAALSALEPDTFLTAQNFSNVLSRSSYSGIIAMGMTAVIISGGIDLSVGSMMALCGMIAGLIMTLHGEVVPTPGLMVLGTLAGVAMGLICGLLNGSLITLLNLPPFIVTLGTMSAFRGISYVINRGMMFDVPTYTFLGEGKIADRREESLKYVLGLDCVDAIVIGFESKAQVDDILRLGKQAL